MHKKCEALVEQYLTKTIGEITIDICQKHFEDVFKGACLHPSPNDTTIGTCYRRLEALANEAVEKRMEELIKEVTSEMGIVRCSPTGNPFSKIACALWEDFLYYYDIKGMVEGFIGDEWSEKEEKLKQDGILDAEGDYTRV